jgi:transposase InsO family protein
MVIQQLRESFPYDTVPAYWVVISTVRTLGIEPKRTAYRSPWQNGVAERWVGSCRRELLDRVIVLHAGHLRRLLREYLAYYTTDRCHLGLEKDPPDRRPTQGRPSRRARVVSLPRVGGLHHRYTWREAA